MSHKFVYFVSYWLNVQLPLVDDGTRVLECHETIKKAQPIQPIHPSTIPPVIEPITPPRRFNVGAVVRIIGTVQSKKVPKESGYNRQVTLQSIEELLDLREECIHWQEVHDLHINQYSKPFSVPPPPALPVQSSLTTPSRGRNRVQDPESHTFSRSSVVSCSSPIQASDDVRLLLTPTSTPVLLILSHCIATGVLWRSYSSILHTVTRSHCEDLWILP
jgi:hypothetical protein